MSKRLINDEEKIEEIKLWHDCGMTITELALKYGVSASTIHSIVNAEEAYEGGRKCKEFRKHKKFFTKEEISKIVRLYNQGVPKVRLCELFETTWSIITRVIREETA